ncbi:N-6 DNA methylase [Vaccinium witches'-broom phytoplasma]|uniref:N-6 DNA methylase n=1 Tax=Vaccinium witches'-broom phytoplasma TaxID=85642 RepID=UPI00036C1737|nr:N-6 DNA methylase [Vaccinium witches'-broom phytoplasma]
MNTLEMNDKLELDNIIKQSASTARMINIKLRSLEVQYRPILISILLICLKQTDFKKEFDDKKHNKYHYRPDLNENEKNRKIDYKTVYDKLLNNINISLDNVLKKQNINYEKIQYLCDQMNSIKSLLGDDGLEIIKYVLKELNTNIYHLLEAKNKYSYDIIGNFYEIFLSYAGVTHVKNGIVLTPRHITELFTKLIPISSTDVILDPCCGTGGFLIAGMNAVIEKLTYKNEKNINQIKENQIIGFDKDPTMYALSISNMLFRGDGKSRIYNLDFFHNDASNKMKKLNKPPTIGFINPPYGGKSNNKNPTKKEIEFLIKLLGVVHGYVVMIAPLSVYMKDTKTRNKILQAHTLEKIIQMPNKLFEPNASTHTAISIFKTNIPHNNKEVDFYNLEDDGLVLFKNKGRIDRFNKWDRIETKMLNDLSRKNYNDINCLSHVIKKNHEWTLFAYSKVDYSKLNRNDFILTLKKYIVFQVKKVLNIFNENLDEITLLEQISQEIILPQIENKDHFNRCNKELKTSDWEEFTIESLFDIQKINKETTKEDLDEFETGNYPYITSTSKNNGSNGFYDHYTEEGNCITICALGYCFYQKYPFLNNGHDSINIIRLKNKVLNEKIALFFVTLINQEMFKYSYSRRFNQERIQKTIIKLPVVNQGNPDWQFMKSYIKSLPYGNSLAPR